MAAAKGRAWKLERASVHHKNVARPKSNKYSKSDNDQRPAPRRRKKIWVGGYSKIDGTRVNGHYRSVMASSGTASTHAKTSAGK